VLPAELFEAAPDGIVVTDPEGRITWANARAHTLFGYPPGELVDLSVESLVPDDARAAHVEHRRRFLAGGAVLRRLALRGRRRDGSVFPVEISLSLAEVGGSAVGGSAVGGSDRLVVAIVRDDTAHQHVAQTQALLASIVQSSHDAIVSTDLDGRVLSWNPGAERLYGYAETEMLGRPVDTIIPIDRRSDEAEIRMLVAAGGRVDRYRSVRRSHDGHPVSVSVLVSPLTDRGGVILGVTTITRDVSDRERAEAQVQAVLDAAPDALLGVDDTGRVVLVNVQAERLFGFPRYDMTHMTVRHLLPGGLPPVPARLRHEGDPTPLDTAVLADQGDGTAYSTHWASRTALRRDGTQVPVEIAASALRTDSGPIVLAAVRDVTERLAAQAEQERLREEAELQQREAHVQRNRRLESLGQLAGGIAHDFNNLLAAILNYAAFIKEDAAGTPSEADADQIMRASHRGSELTHQLLAFARREVIRPRPLDLNAVITDVERMLTRSIGEHIVLTANLCGDLAPVMVDPGQMEQVLVNLAVNARDAMPSGGHLTIDTATVDIDDEHAGVRAGMPSGRYVRMRISDTGAGMPKEVIERAFEPFFTTKASGSGTGLGLATVYGIVTQAGGTVNIYSEPGFGTTITVLLPVTDETPAEAAAGPPAPPQEPPTRQATILVIDDEPALREVTVRILTRTGFTVLSASDGAAALKIAADHDGDVDLLLTDVIMPGMLGKELAERFGEIRPKTRILFMSGYAQPVLASHGTLPPGVHLLEKPFTSDDLLRAIDHQLR
jgi:two-component system, cell cycle sensor histidine kinase and response regulator CckA